MIGYACHSCGKRLEAPAKLAGQSRACRHCGAGNKIPRLDSPEAGKQPSLTQATDTLLPVPPIDGWLILPAIGRLLDPVLRLVDLYKVVALWLAGLVSLGPLFALSIVEYLFMVYLAFMFFQKRRVVPKILIAFFAYGAIWAVISLDKWFPLYDLASPLSRIIGLLSAPIWIVYFLVSKRVKRTFVVPGWWVPFVRQKDKQ